MVLHLTVDLRQEMLSMSQAEIIELVRLLCEHIDTEGVIDEVRKIVNDTKWDDQPAETSG